MTSTIIAISISIFLGVLAYQVACDFPLFGKIRDKKRQKKWNEQQRLKAENEAKIKLLNKTLSGTGDVETYVLLSKFSLPEDKLWQPLLPRMIKELLEIGWTTEMPIHTSFKYRQYEIMISNCSQDLIEKSRPIFHKYIDL